MAWGGLKHASIDAWQRQSKVIDQLISARLANVASANGTQNADISMKAWLGTDVAGEHGDLGDLEACEELVLEKIPPPDPG